MEGLSSSIAERREICTSHMQSDCDHPSGASTRSNSLKYQSFYSTVIQLAYASVSLSSSIAERLETCSHPCVFQLAVLPPGGFTPWSIAHALQIASGFSRLAVRWVKLYKCQSNGDRSGASISMDAEEADSMKAVTRIPADALQDLSIA